jgi:hypothetical protein
MNSLVSGMLATLIPMGRPVVLAFTQPEPPNTSERQCRS